MHMQRPHVAIAPRARLGAPGGRLPTTEDADLWLEILLLAGFFSVAFILGACAAFLA